MKTHLLNSRRIPRKLASACFLSLALATWADVLELKNGTVLNGKNQINMALDLRWQPPCR